MTTPHQDGDKKHELAPPADGLSEGCSYGAGEEKKEASCNSDQKSHLYKFSPLAPADPG